MSNYTKTTNFASKDNLNPGNPLKIVKGAEIDTEYNNIATAVATKTDNASAAITGGTISGITDLAVADGGTGASTATAALNNLLPSQTSNANKYLQTDGTNSSWSALSVSASSITGTLAVANGGTGVTSSTGTGNVVLSTSPTLVTPVLGTPTSGTLTNATGLPISTGVSGLGTGIATFLATPSSANLAAALTDETGSGANVFATSPTLVTPILGTPTSATLTNATGLPLSTGVTGTLPVANGGTGTTTPSLVAGTNVTVTGTWPNQTITASGGGGGGTPGGSTTQVQYNNAGAFGGITGATTNGTALTLVAPVLGTPASATLTNATGLPLTTGVTGTLPVANGGTGTTTPNLVAGTNVTITGTWPNQTIASGGGLTSSRQVFTATASQTTFSITYSVGYVDVYLNGVKLVVSSDFTATNGTSIVLATGATAGDIIDVVAFGIFDVANAYNKADADAKFSTFTGTETLTNKTLTAPVLTSPNITTALTLTGASGTSGQVLTSAGSGLAPTWQTPSGSSGALVLLNSQTVAGGVTAVNLDYISATYTNYILVIEGLYSPAATTQTINIRYRCSGTADTNAVYAEVYAQNTGSAWTLGGVSGLTDISLVPSFPNGDTIARSYFGTVDISSILNSSGNGFVIRSNAYVQNPTGGGAVTYTNLVTGTYAGASGLNSAVTGVQVRLNGATMTGKISLYGRT
jgi:hypothetical protein